MKREIKSAKTQICRVGKRGKGQRVGRKGMEEGIGTRALLGRVPVACRSCSLLAYGFGGFQI